MGKIWDSKKAFIHPADRKRHYEEHLSFMEKHKDAYEIVFSKNSHFPIAAVYFSMEGKQEQHISAVLDSIRGPDNA